MNQRVLHLRVDLLLRLLLCVLPWLMLGAPLTASAARGDPVAIDSPSWQALMARPAAQDGTTAFYAADLLATWGRRDEADSLRRALLVRHLRTLAGDSVPEATLGQVWATAPATLAEVAAAPAGPRCGRWTTPRHATWRSGWATARRWTWRRSCAAGATACRRAPAQRHRHARHRGR